MRRSVTALPQSCSLPNYIPVRDLGMARISHCRFRKRCYFHLEDFDGSQLRRSGGIQCCECRFHIGEHEEELLNFRNLKEPQDTRIDSRQDHLPTLLV